MIEIKQFLEKSKMSQRELAKQLQVSEGTLSRWLHGSRNPIRSMRTHILTNLSRLSNKNI